MVNICFRQTIRSHPLSQAFIRYLLLPALISLFCFPPPYIHAQLAANPAFTQSFAILQPNQSFMPAVLKGVQIIPDNPLRFNFYIDSGSQRLEGDLLKNESTKLIKYFLAALTIPDQDLWVNLSPYEENRIISDQLAVTEMGAEMLGEDYVLKRLSASLTYPEEGLGKIFWDRIYTRVSQIYGASEMPINTFNKVWIVPEKAVVYESQDAGFIVNARLKVLMEEDYLALKENLKSNEIGIDTVDAGKVRQLSSVSSMAFKEMILPEIEKQINDGEEFASLRQIYYSLILATWYKRNLQKTLLARMYVGKNKTEGIETDDREVKQRVYEQYLTAFKDGVYNYIKEDYDPIAQEVISRRYFSGGLSMGTELNRVYTTASDPGEVRADGAMTSVMVNLIPQRLKDIWQKLARKQTDTTPNTAPEETAPQAQVDQTQPATSGPSHDVVKRSMSAFEYTDQQQNFHGIDLEHYVHAQKRLANPKRLDPQILSQILEKLGLDISLTGEPASHAISKALANGGYTKEIIDSINSLPNGQSTYSDPRLDIVISKQNPNPRGQGINETVSNSIDAIMALSGDNLKIGQFAWGVKQNIDWLTASGEDRIDVVTRKDSSVGEWNHSTILRDKQGQQYIQIKKLSYEEYEKLLGFAPIFDRGTIIKIHTTQTIPLKSDQPVNTQEQMTQQIHTRFAYVPGIKIFTHTQETNTEVNGKEENDVIVGSELYHVQTGGEIHVVFTEHTISTIDNGEGMDEVELSRMFVPKEGTKVAEHLTGQDRINERNTKVKVVHNQTLPHRVSFARNREVVLAFDIPNNIAQTATVEGGLMLEFGRLLDVPESRNEIRIPVNLNPGEISNFQFAVEYMIDQIKNSNQLSAKDKLKYLNTIMVGLSQSVQDNVNYSYVIDSIRGKMKTELQEIIHKLKEEGYVILPHDRQFEKLLIPSGKEVIFADEGIFNWQGAFSLKELGGEIVEGVPMEGQQELPLVVIPFTDESLKSVSRFYDEWHALDETERTPMIKTGRFVAVPLQLGQRLLTLNKKRFKQKLTREEELEFRSLAEKINIAVGSKTATSYEVTAVAPQMTIKSIKAVKLSQGKVDSEEVNGFNTFVNNPPGGMGSQKAQSTSTVPSNANQKYVLAGSEVRNLETGRVLFKNIVQFQLLNHGFYEIIDNSTDIVSGKPEKRHMIIRFEGDEVESVYRFNADEVKINYSSHKKIAMIEDKNTGQLLSIINLDNNETVGLDTKEVFDPTLHNFSNAQVSHDERYVAYFAEDMTVGTFLIILDIEENQRIRKLWVDKSVQFVFHPEVNAAFFFNSTNNITMIDLVSNNDSYAKQFRTDSSGTYTAFNNSDGETHIQVHGSREWISAGTLGVDSIESIRTLWKDGKPFYEIDVISQGRSRILSFDPQNMNYEDATPWEYDYSEEFSRDGLLIWRDNNHEMVTFHPYEIDPLQRRGFQYPHVYKDPHSDLLLDFTEVNLPNGEYRATDLKTGARFRLSGQLVKYVPALKMVLTRTNGGVLSENYEDIKIAYANRYVAVEGPASRFGIFLNQMAANSKYSLMNFETGHMIDLQVTDDVYEEVSFDGEYFLFTNPETGDTVYLDPENPDQPALVSDQLKTTKYSAFSAAKPPDAQGRWVIGLTSNGKYDIIDTQGAIERFGAFEEVEMVNNDVFIGYDYNRKWFSIVKNGSIIFKDGRYTIHSYRQNWIMMERPGARFIFDLATERTYPDWEKSIFESKSVDTQEIMKHANESSLEAEFSSSGRFTVHKLKNEKLVLYDQTASDPQPTEILHLAEGDEYLVHPNADVVIVKEKSSGKYRLFNLLDILESDWSQPLYDHIEIDSTGTIAFVKIDFKIGWKYLKRKHFSRLSTTRFPSNDSFVRVSSDNHFVYILYQYETEQKDKELLKFNKATGEFVAKIILDKEKEKTPRFWEQYDFKKKSIYDRETDGKPANWQKDIASEFPYEGSPFSTASTYPPLIQLENNNVILNFGISYDEGWKSSGIDIRDIQTGQSIVTPGKLKGSEEMKSFGGGLAFYVRMSSGVYQINSFKINKVSNAREILVNDNKTFLLARLKDKVDFLMNFAGEITDITTQIPEGFVPTGVNGDYFTFANPLTGETRYLDPRIIEKTNPQQSSSNVELSADQEKARELWITEVTPKRKSWIAQAQSGYIPVLKMVTKQFPELEFKINEQVHPAIAKVYDAQQKEIATRFKKAIEADKAVDWEEMPFDRFAVRSQQLQEELSAYLKELETDAYVSQEEYLKKSDYYVALLAEIIALAANSDVNTDQAMLSHPEVHNRNLFEALGHGWEIKTQEQLNLVPVIGALVSQIKSANNQVKMRDVRKIVQFLSRAVSRDPSNSAKIVKAQLERIFKLKERARFEYLNKLVKAFAEMEFQKLIAYLDNPQGAYQLQDARPFVIFLTHAIDPIREETSEERALYVPDGVDEKLPVDGVELSQIAELEEQRPKKNDQDIVMSIDYFIEHVFHLPEASERAQTDILQDIKLQRESGAYTAEDMSNASDAGAANLEVEFYLHTNENGQQELVEEISDDGSGAEEEMALLIRRSTKAAGNQMDFTGFFGMGKFTNYDGVDRVEMITKNKSGRAFMLTVALVKDTEGNPVGIRLLRLRRLNDVNVKKSFKIRRIKAVENTIPELDQMLAQRNWKVFAGLAQRNDFKITFINHEKQKHPLAVESEILSETDFKAVRPGQSQLTNFGKIRLIATKDMPMQIIDRVGLRVTPIIEEYLALFPSILRRHLEELGINIQIPLPLTGGRSGFEYGKHFSADIQKYVAIELFKAIAYKTLTQNNPQFSFEGFSLDGETNDIYWQKIDEQIVKLSELINQGQYNQIRLEDLGQLLTTPGQLDFQKKAVDLIWMLQVNTPEGRMSLLDRRRAIQKRVNPLRAKADDELFEKHGLKFGPDIDPETIPIFSQKIEQGLGLELATKEMKHPENYVIPLNDYTQEEKKFVAFAYSAASLVGLEQVVLMSPQVSFAVAFKTYQGKRTMFLNRLVVRNWGVANAHFGMLDEGTNQIVHELAHLLEQLAYNDLWEKGYVTYDSEFTHDQNGTFSSAMKYMANLWLIARSGMATPVSETTPAQMNKQARSADKTISGDSAMTSRPENVVTADSALLSQSQPKIKNESTTRPEEVGGIDFNPAALQIETLGAGLDFKLPYNFQEIESMPIGGFSPVILQMTPVTSLPLILGQKTPSPPELSLAK